ncbi:MAG: hypothetical protein M2R45_01716 [Verrucomicrobia subdivision 3 bacterium]|nr:hypothetical protein [Limisphaerales bacterium]MCS1413454.1 hypothetical protein [Limisphaerales bacterium]
MLGRVFGFHRGITMSGDLAIETAGRLAHEAKRTQITGKEKQRWP